MAALTNIIKSIPVDNKEYFGLKYFDKFMKPVISLQDFIFYS